MTRSLCLLALSAALTLTACDAKTLSQVAAGADAGKLLTGNGVELKGKIYAPADQVAVIASGALNWQLLARADEKGVKGAVVKVSPLAGGATTTAQTDATGAFTLLLPPSESYQASATFTAKDGKSVTLSGLVALGATSGTLQLDVAHNLVASSLLKKGLKQLDSAKLAEAVAAMQTDLETVSKAPAPTTRDEAAASFDELAGEATKKLVSGLAK